MRYFDTTPKFLETRIKNQKKKKKKKRKTISKATMMSKYLITEKCSICFAKVKKKDIKMTTYIKSMSDFLSTYYDLPVSLVFMHILG